ncbi:MAG: DUF6544 family protein [Syntrophomonadaceae bacterium]|jgi:hypothetical protein
MKFVIWFIMILGLAVVIIVTASYSFQSKVKAEVKELFRDYGGPQYSIVSQEDLHGLPAPVQRWLKRSNVIGKEMVKTVRLTQAGQMRTSADQAWMPFTAQQYFNVEKPGFIWYARINPAPLVHIAGRDKYYEGQGHMLIKIMSLANVANASGKEMNQGALVRYLAETIWYPAAALSEYIQWETIDENSARATMEYEGTKASGVFTFDLEGNVISFTAKRFREVKGQYTLDDWFVRAGDYKEFGGIRIPSRGIVKWQLPEGDFEWLQVEITNLEYNKPYYF